MRNLDSVLRRRDIILLTKVHLVKAMVFPVVMYGCEIWTIKKTGNQRIDAFELWSWKRLLWVPWTARRSNQSILKKINPEYSLEGLMLQLKLWYFGHLMGRASYLEKTLMLGKIEGKRRRGWQRMRWLDGITNLMSFPGGSDGKESACNVGNLSSILGWGRSLGEGNGSPFQYICLENSMGRGAWWATAHGVTKSWTPLSD